MDFKSLISQLDQLNEATEKTKKDVRVFFLLSLFVLLHRKIQTKRESRNKEQKKVKQVFSLLFQSPKGNISL